MQEKKIIVLGNPIDLDTSTSKFKVRSEIHRVAAGTRLCRYGDVRRVAAGRDEAS